MRSPLRHVLLRELEALVLERRAELPGLRLQRILKGLREIDEIMEVFAATLGSAPPKGADDGPDKPGSPAGSPDSAGPLRDSAEPRTGVATGRASGAGGGRR